MALGNAANNTIRMDVYDQLAYYFYEVNADSSLLYAEKELQIARQLNLKIYEANALVHQGYDFKRKNLLAYHDVGFDEQMRLKKLEEEKIQTQNKIKTYAMLAGIAVFMLIAFPVTEIIVIAKSKCFVAT